MNGTDGTGSLQVLLAELLLKNQVLRDRIAAQEEILVGIRALIAQFSGSRCKCHAEQIVNETKLLLNLYEASTAASRPDPPDPSREGGNPVQFIAIPGEKPDSGLHGPGGATAYSADRRIS